VAVDVDVLLSLPAVAKFLRAADVQTDAALLRSAVAFWARSSASVAVADVQLSQLAVAK
jgi:hypothetical protein